MYCNIAWTWYACNCLWVVIKFCSVLFWKTDWCHFKHDTSPALSAETWGVSKQNPSCTPIPAIKTIPLHKTGVEESFKAKWWSLSWPTTKWIVYKRTAFIGDQSHGLSCNIIRNTATLRLLTIECNRIFKTRWWLHLWSIIMGIVYRMIATQMKSIQHSKGDWHYKITHDRVYDDI